MEYSRDQLTKQAMPLRIALLTITIFTKKKMITEVKLTSGGQSVCIIPTGKLVGPVAIVPNIFTDYCMHGNEETWLAVKPYCRWGRHFGDTIEWIK